MIAAGEAGSTQTAGDAFAAGLLHRVGQIVLATNLAEKYSSVVAAAHKSEGRLQDAEKQRLGVTSGQVGLTIAGTFAGHHCSTGRPGVTCYATPSLTPRASFR